MRTSYLGYGCSVWLFILKTQAGKKTLWSFQLDLHLLKLASIRYLSMNLTSGFSPLSFKILSERVPFLFPTRKIPPVSLLNLPEHPPWAIKVFISSMSGAVVPLLPTDHKVLRLTIQTSRKGTFASFCVVASNSTIVLDVHNSWLSTSASHRHATCSTLSKALEIISLRRHAFKYFEIWLEGTDTPILLQPASSLSLTEVHVFSAIQAPVSLVSSSLHATRLLLAAS